MTQNQYHLQILDIFCLKGTNYSKLNPTVTSKKYLEKHYNELKEVFDYLSLYVNDTDNTISLSEKLYRIKNDLTCSQKCVVCWSHVKFKSFRDGYARHCCKKCACDDPHNKEAFKNAILKNKIRHNPVFGCDLSVPNDNADKCVSSLFILSSGEFDGNKCSIDKRWCQKNINFVNYIINRYSDSSDISENVYRIVHHIDELPRCKICGKPVKYINFIKGYSDTCSHKCAHNTQEYHKKFKQSMVTLFGCEYSLQNKVIRDKAAHTFSDRIKSGFYDGGNSEVSVYASDKEKLVCNTLKPLYPDIMQYYKDERYANPRNGRRWECDFYIPSIDLFIEVQGFRTHGGHPYNKRSIEDIVTVDKLNREYSDGKLFSKDILYTWTKVDPFKRYIAKLNNLNYLELFPDDFNESRIIELVEKFKRQ
jgi:hypothetical protein